MLNQLQIIDIQRKQLQQSHMQKKYQLKTRTGNFIPQIGFGTYQLKGQQCISAVKISLKAGYRHIDTASIYKNQIYIKKAIQQSNVQRKDIYITSKISPYQQGYQKTKIACKQILQKLDINYLDLLLIHWPGVSGLKPDSIQNVNIRIQTWKAMIQLKKQGYVKDIGVSNFMINHLQNLEKTNLQMPVLNQFELHPLLIPKQLIKYCNQKNILIQSYSPLARNDQRLMLNSIIINLAKKYDRSRVQIILRWALQHSYIIIPKSKTQKYIIQNFNITNFQLKAEEIQQIDRLNQNIHICWDPNNVKY